MSIRALPSVLLLSVCAGALPARGDETATTSADALVRSALEAEKQGRNAERETLLQQALAIAPDSETVRWQSGHVKIDGRWLTIDASQAKARGDDSLAEYSRRRAQLEETPAAHLDLAHWCRKSGLHQRERFHLERVLQLPDNADQEAEAMHKLGVRRVDGAYLTLEEIEQRAARRRFGRRSLNMWRPQLESIEKRLSGDDASARAEALAELQAIDSLDAIPALEYCASRYGEEFGLEVVKLLSRMKQQEATDSLIRHAVFAPSENVRKSAAEALAQRPLHSYTETLVGAMELPIHTKVVTDTSSGAVRFRHLTYREGREANQCLVDDMFVHGVSVAPLIGPVGTARPRSRDVAEARREFLKAAGQFDSQVEQQNEIIRQRNVRIHDALVQATGVDLPAEPHAWWKWWSNFNEYDQTVGKPTQVQYRDQHAVSAVQQAHGECFPAGTPVWTDTGKRPIETIRPGDLVLSQDTETGELAYHVVTGNTIRNGVPTVRVWCGDDKITATTGHPFWVVGEGWRMAKFVRPGQSVHTLRGAAAIEQIEEDEDSSVYNLVVEGFHTYFVGEQGVLVHDNMLREPTRAEIPGLVN